MHGALQKAFRIVKQNDTQLPSEVTYSPDTFSGMLGHLVLNTKSDSANPLAAYLFVKASTCEDSLLKLCCVYNFTKNECYCLCASVIVITPSDQRCCCVTV
ncbi:hypothetical protein GOODEAATRI_020084 [Goodea atripinnis]|uniref:Reverse transcriptase/retrotransposon-derived protein RNase H-like domain-containing protein n=1 Tax=Goodea atripinnis TaxID=208336 RepID=A0ABV0PQ45_9TELE